MTEGMRVGYVAQHTGLPSPARTLRLANATPERLREITAANFDALETVIHWNVANGIAVFRLTSDLVPFASHPVNELPWWDEHRDAFDCIGGLMRDHALRLSAHPGQYTVLASKTPHVVDASLRELEYHARMLQAFGLDPCHKAMIHVGPSAEGFDVVRARFAAAFARLSPAAQERLALENDERWPLAEVLPLAEAIGVPVVFDVFHHSLAPSLPTLDTRGAVELAGTTWHARDGRPEVHFSTQAPGKRTGAHAETLDDDAFLRFAAEVGDLPVDCVVEVKDKQASALRAIELLRAAERRRARRSNGDVRAGSGCSRAPSQGTPG